MVADRKRSNSVISQASKCLCVRLACLFEQGDWTSHCPSGMIRPALICCYTDTHMHTLLGRESLSHHPMSSLSLSCCIDCQRKGKTTLAHGMKKHRQTLTNINTHRSKAQSLLVINVHIAHAHHTRMLAHANSKANKGVHMPINVCTQTHKQYIHMQSHTFSQKHDASLFSSCPGSELARQNRTTFTELKTRGNS